MEEYGKRYFEPKNFNKINPFKEKDISTIESLYFSLSEFENTSFSENSSILEALKGGKCI
jgi:type IV secretion system protein VirD4